LDGIENAKTVIKQEADKLIKHGLANQVNTRNIFFFFFPIDTYI